ncbi:aminoglycoside N(3)-acetyltransferase [Paenibacillus sp. 2TAF8]|uniref:aminoglycoside N(3)-acetyltransferase n=1 Tax=Paenibacillus sp. 2TAF8 TaxID=3233020 RepID=UPI003F9DEB8D
MITGGITKSMLVKDLRRLGVEKGMTIIVHSSYKAVGRVVGGPVSVILALEEAIGPNGNLVMPTQTEHLCEPSEHEGNLSPEEIEFIKDNMPIYYPDLTPTSYMGIIPELFRKQDGVFRSSHPHMSFAAWGKESKRITKDHGLHYALNEKSPLGKIYDVYGRILLLGAPADSNTSLHLAEYRQQNSFVKPKVWAVKMLMDGHEQWTTYDDINNESDDFELIFNEFKMNTSAVIEGRVGEAMSYLIPQREMVDYALGWMNRKRREYRDIENT